MTKKTTERAKKALQQAAAFADQETMQALLEYITQLERALLDANQYGWIRGESWI